MLPGPMLFLITRPTTVTDTSLQSSCSHDRWKLKSDFNYSSKAQLVVQFISILFKNKIAMKKKFSVFFHWCQKILAIAIIFSSHYTRTPKIKDGCSCLYVVLHFLHFCCCCWCGCQYGTRDDMKTHLPPHHATNTSALVKITRD